MDTPVRFGRYLLERRLAIGGMAEVFLGRIEGPEGFEKKVVVKRILPHLQHDANHIDMFLDEARLAARFSHPNLIQVYELTRIEEQYCLAMEYIEGKDVAAILDESLRLGRKTPLAIAAFIIASAAEGLHYVHELRTDDGELLNVVHRDISPANIIVTWSGGVKIVDFGIAKHKIATSRTLAGTLKGKFSYMSPEQARGEAVDRRSDIFSLGTIFYELLTISPCFTGSNQLEILDTVTRVRYTPPRKIRRDIPAEIEQILGRMLTGAAANRYRSAAEVHTDLQRWLASTTIPSPNDVGAFLSKLFDRAAAEVPSRVATAIQDWDEIPVTAEYASPQVMTDESSYKLLVDSQLIGLAELDRMAAQRTGKRPREMSAEDNDLVPFDIPSSLHDRRRRSTLSHVADRLRQPRYWPTTLTIFAVALLLAGCILVMVYRSVMGRPWKPHELIPEIVGAALPGPTPDEVVEAVALHVVTDPPGAQVTVDGDVQDGRTPMTIDNVALRVPHTFVLEMDGCATVSKTLVLTSPEMQALSLTLPPAGGSGARVTRVPKSPPPADEPGVIEIPLQKVRATGLLTLDSTPSTDVYVGGEKIGSTPLRRYKLPAGKVMVQLKHPRLGLSKALELDIPEADTLLRKVVFKRGRVLFDIRPWAEVYLRRKKLGTTPMPPILLYEGTYAIRLVNPDLGVEKIIQVTVRGGKTKKVVERMN